ncbi:hypothetical protein ACGFSB_15375 [Streptomyces sp. NPDC048441]|uniref:hypothetical protein n=1 Tax=Streptomyces sp. NPDC048441 TaxID=3365552 RepID=UPI003713C04A
MADPQSNAGVPAHPLPDDAPRAGVLHVRHRHTDRFTVVGNHLAQHPRLSATAIGFAVHIQSLPDGASVTAKALTLRFPEGETTVRRALNELEAAGYLERRRVPLGGGRVATRTFSFDKPGCASETPEDKSVSGIGPSSAPTTPAHSRPAGASVRVPPKRPSLPPQPVGPAADLLARLRLVDPRLLLSTTDVRTLAPAVDTWFARNATPGQIVRTLTANLPPDPTPIHHPARFLGYRLTTLLPPPLPAAAAPPQRAAPLQTCDGCDRAFRTHDATELCADCRTDTPAAA